MNRAVKHDPNICLQTKHPTYLDFFQVTHLPSDPDLRYKRVTLFASFTNWTPAGFSMLFGYLGLPWAP